MSGLKALTSGSSFPQFGSLPGVQPVGGGGGWWALSHRWVLGPLKAQWARPGDLDLQGRGLRTSIRRILGAGPDPEGQGLSPRGQGRPWSLKQDRCEKSGGGT